MTSRAQSGYVWAPGSAGSTRLLARLLEEGFNVAISERPLVVGDTAFPRGSLIARVSRNSESLHERLDALAREAGGDCLSCGNRLSVARSYGDRVGGDPHSALAAPGGDRRGRS